MTTYLPFYSIPVTTSTDLLEGPLYNTCFPDAFALANKYANLTPVTLFPVPEMEGKYQF